MGGLIDDDRAAVHQRGCDSLKYRRRRHADTKRPPDALDRVYHRKPHARVCQHNLTKPATEAARAVIDIRIHGSAALSEPLRAFSTDFVQP
jgi:hypothetical protein